MYLCLQKKQHRRSSFAGQRAPGAAGAAADGGGQNGRAGAGQVINQRPSSISTQHARPHHHLQPVRTRVFIFFITYTLFGFSRSAGDKKQSHAIN